MPTKIGVIRNSIDQSFGDWWTARGDVIGIGCKYRTRRQISIIGLCVGGLRNDGQRNYSDGKFMAHHPSPMDQV